MGATESHSTYQENIKSGRRRRIVIATAFAPWTIVPIVALWILVGRFQVAINVVKGGEYFAESFVTYLSFVALWSLFGVGVAYVVTIVYGIPIFLTLSKYEHESRRSIVLAGAIGSGLLAILIGADLLAGVVFVACGITVSAVFWTIVNRRNNAFD